MFEDLKDSLYNFRSLSKNAEGLFCTSSEDALSARHSKTVHDVRRETKRNPFGDWEKLTLGTRVRRRRKSRVE